MYNSKFHLKYNASFNAQTRHLEHSTTLIWPHIVVRSASKDHVSYLPSAIYCCSDYHRVPTKSVSVTTSVKSLNCPPCSSVGKDVSGPPVGPGLGNESLVACWHGCRHYRPLLYQILDNCGYAGSKVSDFDMGSSPESAGLLWLAQPCSLAVA